MPLQIRSQASLSSVAGPSWGPSAQWLGRDRTQVKLFQTNCEFRAQDMELAIPDKRISNTFNSKAYLDRPVLQPQQTGAT